MRSSLLPLVSDSIDGDNGLESLAIDWDRLLANVM